MIDRRGQRATDVSVGRRIKMRRAEQGVSQGAVAAQLGVTYQQVQKYESGRDRVGAGRLQAIARALEVSVSYFFQDLPPSPTPGMPTGQAVSGEVLQFLATPEGLQVNRAFARIKNSTLRRRVLALLISIGSD